MTTMNNQNTFFHIIDIDANKRKSDSFAKVCELMYVDTNSTKNCLKGKLDFSWHTASMCPCLLLVSEW